jgi:hypothetical protein
MRVGRGAIRMIFFGLRKPTCRPKKHPDHALEHRA